MSKKSTSDFDFEKALDELESLVARMEEGDLPLDEALKQFEHGVSLTRRCQQALEAARQKVDILVEKDGESAVEPFETDK